MITIALPTLRIPDVPLLLATVTTVGGLVAPSPLPRLAALGRFALASLPLLLKGAPPTMANLDTVKAYLAEAKQLAELGVEFLPGTTAQEKAAGVESALKPGIDAALSQAGASAYAVDFVNRVFDAIVDDAVKALVPTA